MKKYLYYTILLANCLFLLSCAKEEDKSSTIPYARVEIDIQTQLEHEFLNPYHSKIYKDKEFTGYGGVIAISNSEGSYIFAFDLCCPHEAPAKNILAIKNTLEVQCPKCKSVFTIGDGSGKATSGPATERLRAYRVIQDGAYFRIRN